MSAATRLAVLILVLFTPILLLIPASAAPGQRLVYVPDASAGQGACNGIPFGSGTEWRYQVMVSAGQLGSLPGRIVELALAPCSSGTFTADSLEVRIAHSFSSQLTKNFKTNLAGNLTTLFQGKVR